jgi:hypothetical protein
MLTLLGAASLAKAADAPNSVGTVPFSLIDEIRFGGFYDVLDRNKDMVSAEALSSPLGYYHGDNPFLKVFLDPRLVAGAMVNTNGLVSYVFAGVNWRVPIYQRLFIEGEFGGAVNDGASTVGERRIDLGCPLTFRESGGIGLQITSNIDIVASVEHISHADLCGRHNPGLTDVGLRLGYKF